MEDREKKLNKIRKCARDLPTNKGCEIFEDLKGDVYLIRNGKKIGTIKPIKKKQKDPISDKIKDLKKDVNNENAQLNDLQQEFDNNPEDNVLNEISTLKDKISNQKEEINTLIPLKTRLKNLVSAANLCSKKIELSNYSFIPAPLPRFDEKNNLYQKKVYFNDEATPVYLDIIYWAIEKFEEAISKGQFWVLFFGEDFWAELLNLDIIDEIKNEIKTKENEEKFYRGEYHHLFELYLFIKRILIQLDNGYLRVFDKLVFNMGEVSFPKKNIEPRKMKYSIELNPDNSYYLKAIEKIEKGEEIGHFSGGIMNKTEWDEFLKTINDNEPNEILLIDYKLNRVFKDQEIYWNTTIGELEGFKEEKVNEPIILNTFLSEQSTYPSYLNFLTDHDDPNVNFKLQFQNYYKNYNNHREFEPFFIIDNKKYLIGVFVYASKEINENEILYFSASGAIEVDIEEGSPVKKLDYLEEIEREIMMGTEEPASFSETNIEDPFSDEGLPNILSQATLTSQSAMTKSQKDLTQKPTIPEFEEGDRVSFIFIDKKGKTTKYFGWVEGILLGENDEILYDVENDDGQRFDLSAIDNEMQIIKKKGKKNK